MNSIIVVFSYHHKNTEKIAQKVAKVIGAEIKTPEQTDPNTLTSFELVGFGSGVYFGKLGKPVLELADKIPPVTNKKAFIFSTSGRAGKAAAKFHKTLKEKLESKGYIVIGELNCAAFDTYGLFKIAGGINKGRPNEDDLKQAETFAQHLLKNEPSVMFVE
ncbi:MAG: flavodoxin family protein [Candidatus Bathyarchaeia archaeon]|jgi:flavodoxin